MLDRKPGKEFYLNPLEAKERFRDAG